MNIQTIHTARNHVFSLGLLVCSMTALASNTTDVEERVLPVQQATTLKARAVEADIFVRVHDEDTVLLRIHRSLKDLDESEADRVLQALKTEFQADGKDIILREDIPGNEKEWMKATGLKGVDFSVQYELWVPASFKLDLKSVDGDLSVEAVAGECQLTTVDGDVMVQGAGAAVQAKTADGDIMIKESRGTVKAQTVDGDIRVSGSTEVQAQTVDGDVTANLSGQPAHDSRLSTTDGDVILNVDPTLAVKIMGHTIDGELQIGLPLENKIASRGQVMGTLNGGGPQILMNTVDGDVIIEVLKK